MFRRDRLKELRKNKKITQKELGVMLGFAGHTAINYYENGKAVPPSSIIQQLAEALNTSTDYLLGITDNPTPYITHQIPILGTMASVLIAFERL